MGVFGHFRNAGLWLFFLAACERVKKLARMLGVNAPDDGIVAAAGQQGEPSQPVQGR